MPTSRRELLRRFRAEQDDPVPFYTELAARTIDGLTVPLVGRRVLDLGCGPGHYTRALRAAGADVVPVDIDADELHLPGGPPPGAVLGDATRLPLPDGSVDGVFSSNMLEHTATPDCVVDEVARVLQSGGWAWMSWTNWFSPFGGHEISPWHYLGARVGVRLYARRTHQDPKNMPGRSLFPLHIGAMLGRLRRRSDLRLVSAVPRYYPSQAWIVRVPGLREFATWNCAVVLERR